MRQTATFFSLLFCLAAQPTFSQTLQLKDSINIFYDSLFVHLENDYIFRTDHDWQSLKPYFKAQALQSTSLQEALDYCTPLFDTIGGTHCQIFAPNSWHGATPTKQFGKEDFSSEFLLKYRAEPNFEVKAVADQYGYVLIPGMLLLGVSQDSLNRKAQEMYDAMMTLQTSQDIKGWIIDLRLNVGGNALVMLTALYHLLGDNVVTTGLNHRQEVMITQRLSEGTFFSNQEADVRLIPQAAPAPDMPVALLIGKLTASAGEDVAIAFNDRDKSILIGTESYGFLTGNDEFKLPFGIIMAMTTGYMADRNGRYTETVVPNILIEKVDNFTDLSKDPHITEAIRFMKRWK